MAFSEKEMPKNHTDKERFAAALSCIQTGILTLLFPLKRRRSSPSPFISHRVLKAVASWILKSLLFESVDGENHFLFSVSNVYLHFSKIDLSHSTSGKRIRSFKLHKLHTQIVHFHLYLLRQRDRLERKMFPSETFVFNTEHS